MTPSTTPRRLTIYLLGGALVLVLIMLASLQAFNIRFLAPVTTGETLAFVALIVIVFLLMMTLIVLLVRNILKLYADQKTSALGARLRTRMVLGAALIAFTPAIFMALYSYGLLNRSIDRWFSQSTLTLHTDSERVVQNLAQYATNNARIEAEEIASAGEFSTAQSTQAALISHHVALVGGFAAAYKSDQSLLVGYQLPPENAASSLLVWSRFSGVNAQPLPGLFSRELFDSARRTDNPLFIVNGNNYAIGRAVADNGTVFVVALPMPPDLAETAIRIRTGAANYYSLYKFRNRIRLTYQMMLGLITAFVFFTGMWLALFLAKQITRPVEQLALAMDEIAAGKYEHRVPIASTGEMADLVRAFNHMAADLESSRHLAEISTTELSKANLALKERRRELETILETIPSGVVTLSPRDEILQYNKAFVLLLGLKRDHSFERVQLASLLPNETNDEVQRIIRRSQRMGSAAAEFEAHINARNIHLSVTSARLDLVNSQPGAVLVLEDSSELLLAQRQLAWKEVAQRIAHEIKNPLTPIGLSAERIRRHLDAVKPDSNAVIRKCSEVILGCVSSLRSLVDQFSALAQFPAPQPHATDANQIVESALALFTGRLEGITVQTDFTTLLPPIFADPNSLRRAIANLIDNACEAMHSSLLRVLTLSTALTDDSTAIEITVADTGHGLTDEIRERLFLPFYSTKQRGTGLGLSIASKIAQEHAGSIRAEANVPQGARFLLRIPLAEHVHVTSNIAIAAVSDEPIKSATNAREQGR